MAIRIGTSGWSYPRGNGRWDGVFYPPRMADKEKLSFYAQFFDTVEINNSFYRPPNPDAAQGWAERVPTDFRFTAKLWQKFTHPKMFEEATGQAARISESDFQVFLDGIQPLADAGKLGPVLAQFPPSFKPSEETLEYLEDLIRRLKHADLHLAVELRHRNWTESEDAHRARALMEEEGVAWVMIDEPRFRTSIRDVPLTNRGLGYFRFHGRNAEQWWRHEAGEERYNYHYSPSEQAELAQDVAQVATRTRETYAFYNNHHSAQAIVNALQLKLELTGQAPPLEDLPETLVYHYRELEDFLA
jgi:uncharacterized protein YecE (DUF72 family)